MSVAASKRIAIAAPTTVTATAITAAKRERLCSPQPCSAQATAARTATGTCSYCTKSNHFRDVVEEVVHRGAGLCRARVLQRGGPDRTGSAALGAHGASVW